MRFAKKTSVILSIGGVFCAKSALARTMANKIKNSFQRTAEKAGFIEEGTARTGFVEFLGKYVNALLGLMGLLFLILIIYGGFIWMTAAGNEEKITKAKKIIAGSAIGIGIIFLAMTITMLILGIFRIAGA